MKLYILLLLQLSINLGASLRGKTLEVVQVEMPQGTFEGHTEVETGWNPDLGRPQKFYYSFRGLPYAKPPVGELRFKDPVPPEPWTGVRKSAHPPACPQINPKKSYVPGMVMGNEDCLYLNVHTPTMNFTNSTLLPVMVYIHGGGYEKGHIGSWGGNPERLMMTKEVVLVAIQYRLGFLGFLSTKDSVLTGNYGMKDQTLALKWIKENIHLFGGDPERITIFGESAGGAASNLHMFIPSSQDYFHQAILQSGTAFAAWTYKDDHAKQALDVAKHLPCPEYNSPSSDSNKLLECVMKASVESLINTTYTLHQVVPLYLSPRVDGEYLPASPALLLREGKYKKVNLLSGITKNEGSRWISRNLKTGKTGDPDFMRFIVEEELPMSIVTDEEPDVKYITERIFFHYVPEWTNSFNDSVFQLEELLSDMMFAIDADFTAMMHGRDAAYGAKFYRYELEHRGERSFGGMEDFSFGQDWVSHLDDLMYLFDGVMDFPPVSRKDDLMMSDVILKLWTNFARTGNPTPNMDLGFKWDPMESPTDLRYLSLVPAPSMKENKRNKHLKFWMDLPLMRNKIIFPERFN